MIKINLLGAETTTDDTGNLQIFLYFTSIVVTLVLCSIVYSMNLTELGKREAERDRLQAKLAKLKEQTKEVRDLEEKKKELLELASAIGKLKIIQVGPVRMLSEVDEALPAKLWLRQVNDKGGDMVLSGIALDDFSVSTFLKGLQDIEYFKKVELKESKSVKLVQIMVFNAFDSNLTRYVVPAEERDSKLTMLDEEAKKAGLEFRQENPYRNKWKQGISKNKKGGATSLGDSLSAQRQYNTGVSTSPDTNAFTTGLANKRIAFGVRNNAKDPTVYAWVGLEETDGKLFSVSISSDFLRSPEIEVKASAPAEKGGVARPKGAAPEPVAVPHSGPANIPPRFNPSRGG